MCVSLSLETFQDERERDREREREKRERVREGGREGGREGEGEGGGGGREGGRESESERERAYHEKLSPGALEEGGAERTSILPKPNQKPQNLNPKP